MNVAVISADGRVAATGGADKVVHVWSLDLHTQQARLRGHSYGVGGLALTRDGTRLASICIGEARVWDSVAGTVLGLYDELGQSCGGAVMVDDDRAIVMIESGKRVTRWALETGEVQSCWLGDAAGLECVAATADGAWLLTGGNAGVARVWRQQDTAELHHVGHVFGVSSLVRGDSDDTVWASSPDLGTRQIRIADDDKKPGVALTGHYSSTAMVGFERRLYCAQAKRVAIHAADTGAKLREWTPSSDWLRAIAIDPRQRVLACAGDQAIVFITDLDGAAIRQLHGHHNWIRAIAFTPAGRLLSAGWDGKLLVWDLDQSDRPVLELASQAEAQIQALVIDARGTVAAIGIDHGTVELFDLDAGQRIRILTGHRAEVTGLALRLDGRVLISVSSDQTMRFWSFPAGDPLHVYEAKMPLTRMTMVGDQVVVGDEVGNVMILDVDWNRWPT